LSATCLKMNSDFARALKMLAPLAKAFDSPIELEVPAEKAQEIKQDLLKKSPTAMVETQYGFFFNVLGVRVKVYD
jgi:hypothetical protein